VNLNLLSKEILAANQLEQQYPEYMNSMLKSMLHMAIGNEGGMYKDKSRQHINDHSWMLMEEGLKCQMKHRDIVVFNYFCHAASFLSLKALISLPVKT
jgi:hypothetical protein